MDRIITFLFAQRRQRNLEEEKAELRQSFSVIPDFKDFPDLPAEDFKLKAEEDERFPKNDLQPVG